MHIEDRLDQIEKTVNEIKHILLHKVVPIPAIEPDNPKKSKKPAETPTEDPSKPVDEAKQAEAPLPLTITGVIEGIPKVTTVDRNGTPTVKHSFKIGDKMYGTFDSVMVTEIMSVMDRSNQTGVPILVKIEYTERTTPKNTLLQDIVTFNQVRLEDVKE